MPSSNDAVDTIYHALLEGELEASELSARRIAKRLNRTTGTLYHRYGSFDGFLFAVGQRGFADLTARLNAVWSETRDLGACVAAFVELGLDHPELYALMLERRYDWGALRAAGFFEEQTPGSTLLAGVVCILEAAGSTSAIADTRLLMAGLHGLISFASSGRMNVGALSATDREVARRGDGDLAARLLVPVSKKEKS